MTDPEKAQIERINEVSAMARTSWITLLAYLAFVGVTLLAVEDADFFVPSRQTQLPLVDVAIPTASFFVFAPILAAALYVYLHIILLKLWDAIADADAERIDGQPLGDHLNPWLVNDWALTLKGGAFTPARPLRTVGKWASILLVWAAAPLLLLGFWWWSMPAHNEWLTLLLALFLLLALHAGVTSWRTASAWLANPRRKLADRRWRHRYAWYLGVFLACVTLLRTEFPLQFRTLSTLAPIDVEHVEMVRLPEGWRDRPIARETYREVWCRREGIAMSSCSRPADPEQSLFNQTIMDRDRRCRDNKIPLGQRCADQLADIDARFSRDWNAERTNTIDDLPALDLSGQDLRLAFGPNVGLVGAQLKEARLEEAILWAARLKEANFRDARLERADLSRARLEGADFWEARLNGTVFGRARMDRAILRDAEMQGAILWQAQAVEANFRDSNLTAANLSEANLSQSNLRGANLSEANLNQADHRGAKLIGTNLSKARLKGANFGDAQLQRLTAHSADLRGAKGLTQSHLNDVIGNEGTLLPDGISETGEPLYVWSCWETPPPDFDRIVATAAGPLADDAARTARASLRAEFLCGPDNPRRRTGTPLAVDAPYPEGHPLADRG